MHDAKLGTIDIVVISARGTQHPPVIVSMPFAPNQGVLPAGLFLEASAAGLVPFDPEAATVQPIVAVNDKDVDTGRQDSGLAIIHGSALRELLKVGDGQGNQTEPDETLLSALMKAGIYPE